MSHSNDRTAAVDRTRRNTLALLGATTSLSLLSRGVRAAGLDQLDLYGPPAGPSVTLAQAVASGAFAKVTDTARFTAWRSPDELHAGLTSGSMQISVVPVQAAANLYNRGFPIRLANVMTNGLLYLLSDDPDITNIPDLAGRRVAVPFRGDTPEIIFSRFVAHHELDSQTDLQITYAGTPFEAMQLLLAGRVDAALTAEPSTTAGVLQGTEAGKAIRRVIDIQAASGTMTSATPVLPQAGLAVTQGFLDTHGHALPEILTALAYATDDVLVDPYSAAQNATEALGLPAPLIAASIPFCNLVARPSAECCADVERLLNAMAGEHRERIGGKLPDDGFYV